MIPTTPRINFALRKAREFILVNDIQWLPVDPFSIARDNGWDLVTVGEISQYKGLPREKVIESVGGSEGVACRDPKTGKFKIIYDENQYPAEKIKWTIMHEIGHIFLGHLTEFNESKLYRGGLTEPEYYVLEREVDTFAAEVLAPMAILKKLGFTQQQEIEYLCQITYTASGNRERDIKWRGFQIPYCEADELLCEQFEQYLTPVTYCIDPEKVFGLISNYKRNPRRSFMSNKIDSVIMDENTRKFLVCPRCGNDEFSDGAEYCKLCGLYLYNVCINSESFNPETSNIVAEVSYDGCGAQNPADARYCEYCGSETFIAHLGLFKSWEELQRERDGKPIEINADELPF